MTILIGKGRLARHLKEYLRLSGQEFQTWNRQENTIDELVNTLRQAQVVLLAISDRSLAEFFNRMQSHAPKALWVHFSGALEIPGMLSFHPLMTFSEDLYDLKTYQSIPFITTGTVPLTAALPGFKNPVYRIPADKKARYHALCVLSGNFTTLLWQKLIGELRSWDLPQGVGHSYARQTIENVFHDPDRALTGPLARNDVATQVKNLAALDGDPFADIYRAFQTAFRRLEQEKNP